MIVRVLTLALLLLAPSHVFSQEEPRDAGDQPDPAAQTAPSVMHYQARFTESGGAPLAGPLTLTFRLFATSTGGSSLWTESHSEVPLQDGVASVLLGSLNSIPADAFFGSERFLGITVDGADELAPRLRLASVPFALEASRLRGKTSDDFEPRGEVQSLALGDGNPPNQGRNSVHWDNLSGVPEDFADGEDKGVTDHGELTDLQHDDHPQYALDDDLAASEGAGPNTGKNLVHWENLVGVPSGFADGADNTGSGGGVDHGELLGLEDDDHPQYATDVDLDAHTLDANPHAQYALGNVFDGHAADTTLHGRTTDAGDLTEGTLDPDRLPLNAIASDNIIDGSITGADVADDTITGDHVVDGTLAPADFQAGALDTLLLGPEAVKEENLAPGAVTSEAVADGALTADDLADSTLTAVKLVANAVNGDKVADGSLTGADLAIGSVSAANLSDEPGFAFATDSAGRTLVGGNETVLQAVIDCPVGGFVLAMGTLQACVDSPGSPGDQSVVGSVSQVDGDLDPQSQSMFRVFASPGQVNCGTVASQKVFPVSPGQNTFYFVVRGQGLGPLQASRINLSLVFLPTQY